MSMSERNSTRRNFVRAYGGRGLADNADTLP